MIAAKFMSRDRLHILQIFNRYLQYGGEEGSIVRIGDALQALHGVDYFFYSTAEMAGTTPFSKLLMPMKTLHNGEVRRRLEAAQARGKFDLWQIHNVFPAMSPVVYELALERKIPIVHYLHNYRLACVNGFFLNHGAPCQRCIAGNFWPAFATACWRDSHLESGWMGLITSRMRGLPLFEKVFRWVAISEAQKRLHVKMGIPAERIQVIPHFLEPEFPPPPATKNPTALFVGRLSTEKGVSQLLQAWKLIQGGERKLVIVGDGPARAGLEEEARKLHGVRLTGFIEAAAQRPIWAEALFSVVPSIWEEPFGMAVLESWAHGRPVLAHAIGALPELIQSGVNGMMADPARVEDLAQGMDRWMEHPEEAETLGLNGRRGLEETFSKRVWLGRISRVYEDLPKRIS